MVGFRKPNKRMFSTAIVMIVLGFSGLFFGIYKVNSSQADPGNAQLPTFTTVLPASKTIDQLGGWQKLTPPKGEPVWVYVDNLSGVSINVSQQKLPGNIKIDEDNRVADLARGYNANTKLEANGTTFYIGSSAKGPQSVIFAKNGVLVLIKSWATIENDSWIEYISSLETNN